MSCINRVNPSNIEGFKFEHVMAKEQNYNWFSTYQVIS